MSTTATEVRLGQIGQISVTVHDLEKAIAFYRDVLGMHFLFQVPKMAFFDCGGVRLMLGIPEVPAFDHPASVIYYKIADIHAAFEALRACSVAFKGKPHLVAKLPDHELWMTFFEDLDGNTLALMSEVRGQ